MSRREGGYMQTLALLYMGAGIVSTISGLVKGLDSEIEVINLVNDGILPAAQKNGNELTSTAFEQLMHSLMTAELAGADAMMVTCSSISEFVDYAQPFARIPVFKIDEPMFLEALSRGTKIGVAATVGTTLKPSLRQLKRLAEKNGKEVEIDSVLIEPAYQAFLQGNINLHNELIQNTLKELCDRNDAVCLAQASMLSVVQTMPEEYQRKILSSPASGVKRVVDYLRSVR